MFDDQNQLVRIHNFLVLFSRSKVFKNWAFVVEIWRIVKNLFFYSVEMKYGVSPVYSWRYIPCKP